MISFKDSKDQTPSALAVLGIALLVVSGVVSAFFSRGIDTNGFNRKLNIAQAAFNQRSLKAKSDRSVYEFATEKYQWSDKEDIVTPQALAIISKRADENHLKLVSFRPTKSSEVGSMLQLPLQFTVDGSFASVTAMLESLQINQSKLAVQSVQLASQEGQSDLVSANVSLVAFLVKPIKKTISSTTKTQSSQTIPATTAGSNSN